MARSEFRFRPFGLTAVLFFVTLGALCAQTEQNETTNRSARTDLGLYAGALFGYGYDNYSTNLTAFQNYSLNRTENSLSSALQVGMKWALLYTGIDFVLGGTQTVTDDRWSSSTELYDYQAGEMFAGLAAFYPLLSPAGWEISPGIGIEFSMALYRTLNGYNLMEGQDLAMDLLANGYLRLNKTLFNRLMFTSLIMGGYNFFPDPYNQAELREGSMEIRFRALFGLVYRFG